MTREQAAKAIQDMIDHPYAWAIEASSFIGGAYLNGVGNHDRRASLAMGILDPARLGQGLGTEAALLVLDFAFRQLALHRVVLRVLACNGRAIRCYAKCGFMVEGRERESAFVNGRWQDDLIMGLLDREFLARTDPGAKPAP